MSDYHNAERIYPRNLQDAIRIEIDLLRQWMIDNNVEFENYTATQIPSYTSFLDGKLAIHMEYTREVGWIAHRAYLATDEPAVATWEQLRDMLNAETGIK